MKIIILFILLSLLSVSFSGYADNDIGRAKTNYEPAVKPILRGNNYEYELLRMPEFRSPTFLYERGIEGYVIIEFSVNRDGRTSNHKITESENGDLIGPAAIKHISRYKYNPRVVNGETVKVDGVRQMLTLCFHDRISEQGFIFEHKSERCEKQRNP